MNNDYIKKLETRTKEYEECFKQIRLLLLQDTCMVSSQCLKMIDLLFKYQSSFFK